MLSHNAVTWCSTPGWGRRFLPDPAALPVKDHGSGAEPGLAEAEVAESQKQSCARGTKHRSTFRMERWSCPACRSSVLDRYIEPKPSIFPSEALCENAADRKRFSMGTSSPGSTFCFGQDSLRKKGRPSGSGGVCADGGGGEACDGWRLNLLRPLPPQHALVNRVNACALLRIAVVVFHLAASWKQNGARRCLIPALVETDRSKNLHRDGPSSFFFITIGNLAAWEP